MTISPAYPDILQNGTAADATQVMADFYQIQNDVNANAAANGANSDITSLTGLTTPLGVSYGGTGGSSAAAALTALGAAPLASPVFTGDPQCPTPATGDNDTSIATTAFVVAALGLAGFAPLNSPVFTGDPKVPTASPGDNDTSAASTAFVTAAIAAIPTPIKAWVVFNGVSGVAIAASFNIASIVRNSVGDYTLNFSNALADANYAVATSFRFQGSGGINQAAINPLTNPTANSLRLQCAVTNIGGASFADNDRISVIITR